MLDPLLLAASESQDGEKIAEDGHKNFFDVVTSEVVNFESRSLLSLHK